MQDAETRGVNVTVSELDEMEVNELANKKNVVVLCSTCGNGELPKNARVFFGALSEERPADLLKGVKVWVTAASRTTTWLRRSCTSVWARWVRIWRR